MKIVIGRPELFDGKGRTDRPDAANSLLLLLLLLQLYNSL